ncbi:hypothetical protein BU17DRAFT_39442, partial [Hysterangium stoloniferum]
IWWSNVIVFTIVHIWAIYGILYTSPFTKTPTQTLVMTVILNQLTFLGITVGYHRLFSHRAFQTTMFVKIILAILGAMGCQGAVRHRLHHRFTDDPEHDPYAASRGLVFSHVGWIFFKPSYPRMSWIEKDDLDKDIVVRIQDRYFVYIAGFFSFIVPPLVGMIWGDALGAFIWSGLVSRVLTWHCTFLINSLAHWEGLQHFTDEVSAKKNLLVAVCTSGEGNHNFHAFPYDFRAGPALLDWDPSKWVILLLRQFRLAKNLQYAAEEDIQYAMAYMRRKNMKSGKLSAVPLTEQECNETSEWTGPTWSKSETQSHVKSLPGKCLILVDDFLIDVTTFMKTHPGGAKILRTYSLKVSDNEVIWQDATWAFDNLNHHTRMARRRMRQMAIAKISYS